MLCLVLILSKYFFANEVKTSHVVTTLRTQQRKETLLELTPENIVV